MTHLCAPFLSHFGTILGKSDFLFCLIQWRKEQLGREGQESSLLEAAAPILLRFFYNVEKIFH